MIKRAPALALVLIAVAFGSPAWAQSTQFDLGIGYQWLDVSGNQDLYRTHTGDRDGALLDALTVMVVGDKDGLFDRLQIDAAGVGASPDTNFRVHASRSRLFDMSLRYNRAEVFSRLPNYANPLLGATGVIPGQHTYDRYRDALDFDLTLLPGGTISPIVGYSRYHYWGPGTTTFAFGQDEFALGNDIDEKVSEYRVGAGMAFGTWRATILQGWRSTDSSYDYSLLPGANGGNNSAPVLGTPVSAGSLAGHSRTSGTAPFTNLLVTGRLADRVRISGTYARLSGAEANTDDTFTATGQFVSFALARFFQGASEVDATSARATNWRGNVRAEVDLTSWLEVVADFTSSRRRLDGDALLRTTYLGTVNFSGADPKNLMTLVSAATAWDRGEDASELRLLARPTSWISVWVGGARLNQDVAIDPAAAEIVVPGGQGGSYSRQVDRLSAGADATIGPVVVGVDYLTDDADAAVVRTDYTDRDRFRAHATVNIGKFLKVLGSGEWINMKNPAAGILYDADVTHWAAGVDVMPIDALTIHGGYDKYESNSQILIRIPHDFSTQTSIYAEDGENVEGNAALKLGRFMVEAGANQYSNKGDLPFDLDRTYARFDVTVTGGLGVYGQYEKRKYREKQFSPADYDADRYGLFVRWASK
jgi:hypothetical protein